VAVANIHVEVANIFKYRRHHKERHEDRKMVKFFKNDSPMSPLLSADRTQAEEVECERKYNSQ
jgi:hypothetical protein